MKNAVFWDFTPCDSCKNRRFGGTHRLHHQNHKNRQARNMLAVTINRSTLRSNSHRRENVKSYTGSSIGYVSPNQRLSEEVCRQRGIRCREREKEQ
jgi:hypothetical protein